MILKGYKQSEAGLIPEDWKAATLGELIVIRRGHDLTWRDRRAGDIPIMGSAGQNGFHDVALARGPGVVLGRSGASFGQAHYCERDFWPHKTALYVTDFRGNDPLFVFYFVSAIDFSQHNSGGAQQSLVKRFGEVAFPRRDRVDPSARPNFWVLAPKDRSVTTAFLFQLIKTDDFVEAAPEPSSKP